MFTEKTAHVHDIHIHLQHYAFDNTEISGKINTHRNNSDEAIKVTA